MGLYFSPLLYSTDISMLETHSTHSMGISYSRVHGLKPEKLPHLITLPNSFLIFPRPLQKKTLIC